MGTKSQRATKARLASGQEVAQFYSRKAGAHADRRTKRERTRNAVLSAALKDYR